MKHKAKKQRCIVNLQERSASKLAQMALHQQSEIQQYSPFLNSFAYSRMRTLTDESQLSTWNQNQTLYPNSTISQSAVQLSIKNKKIVTHSRFNRTRHIPENRTRLCKQTIESSKEDGLQRVKKRKIYSSKVRCAISLLNPKFEQKLRAKPLQTQSYLKTINSHNFTTQRREPMNEKRSLIIKKIKRDLLHGLQFRINNKSKTNDTQIFQTNREKTLPHSKRYTEVQLKFDSASAEKKVNKQDNSSRISNLQTYRNDRNPRGKTVVKKQRVLDEFQGSRIRASQEFIQLRCLLDKQRVDKNG